MRLAAGGKEERRMIGFVDPSRAKFAAFRAAER